MVNLIFPPALFTAFSIPERAKHLYDVHRTSVTRPLCSRLQTKPNDYGGQGGLSVRSCFGCVSMIHLALNKTFSPGFTNRPCHRSFLLRPGRSSPRLGHGLCRGSGDCIVFDAKVLEGEYPAFAPSNRSFCKKHTPISCSCCKAAGGSNSQKKLYPANVRFSFVILRWHRISQRFFTPCPSQMISRFPRHLSRTRRKLHHETR